MLRKCSFKIVDMGARFPVEKSFTDEKRTRIHMSRQLNQYTHFYAQNVQNKTINDTEKIGTGFLIFSDYNPFSRFNWKKKFFLQFNGHPNITLWTKPQGLRWTDFRSSCTMTLLRISRTERMTNEKMYRRINDKKVDVGDSRGEKNKVDRTSHTK